jgi:hypothetical protein
LVLEGERGPLDFSSHGKPLRFYDFLIGQKLQVFEKKSKLRLEIDQF